MKKDFIVSILNNQEMTEEEKVKAIQVEYGKTVNPIKADMKALEVELSNVKETYLDPDKAANLEQEKKDLEEKLSTIEQTHNDEVQKIHFEHKFNETLKGVGARDIKLLKAVLNMDEVKFEDGEVKGLDEQLENVKKDYEYLFESTETPKKPGFSRKFNLGETGSMTKDEFKALPPTKRTELFKTDPDLYNQLKD